MEFAPCMLPMPARCCRNLSHKGSKVEEILACCNDANAGFGSMLLAEGRQHFGHHRAPHVRPWQLCIRVLNVSIPDAVCILIWRPILALLGPLPHPP